VPPTHDQPDLARAKLAPVQARIVRFQAANCGFAAPQSRACQPAKSRSTVLKTARKANNPRTAARRNFAGRPVFKTGAFNRSATLPRSTKASSGGGAHGGTRPRPSSSRYGATYFAAMLLGGDHIGVSVTSELKP
jgi:hypothetical protein